MHEKLEPIYKVGAIILSEGNLLVVRKYVEGRTEFIIPGGRAEEGETADQTLERELLEELGVEVLTSEFFGRFSEMAIFENVPLIMEVYAVSISGTPEAKSEIKEVVWIDRYYEDKGYNLGSVLAKHVIPRLVERGLM